MADQSPAAFKRINFFRGFMTTEQDWNDAEHSHIEKRKLHNRVLHAPGVIPHHLGGFRVSARGKGELAVEIAPGYAKSDEGRIAPLRRVDINDDIPADLSGIPVERFTPTFVLVENGEEVGRIRGYPGSEFFWFLVDDLIAMLPEQEKTSVPAKSPAL